MGNQCSEFFHRRHDDEASVSTTPPAMRENPPAQLTSQTPPCNQNSPSPPVLSRSSDLVECQASHAKCSEDCPASVDLVNGSDLPFHNNQPTSVAPVIQEDRRDFTGIQDVCSGDKNKFIGPVNIGGRQTVFLSQPSEDQVKLERLWDSLKSRLQAEYRKLHIPKIPWLDWEQNFEDYFVDLTIESKNDRKTKEIHLHEIFLKSSKDVHPNRILIQGPAGYGKTTLAHKLCYDYAKKEKYIQGFEVVILLRLRNLEKTLDDLIINTLNLTDYKAEDVLDSLRTNESKVLLVLDGFDELDHDKHSDVIDLLRCQRLPKSTVVTTSRLASMSLGNIRSESSLGNLLHCMDSRILIKGLTGDNRIQFLRMHLTHSPDKLKSTIKLLEDKFSLLYRRNLFDCPLCLLLLVIVAEEADIDSLNTKTELYKTLFNFILRRMYEKMGKTSRSCDFFNYDNENPPGYVKMLSQFGSFAFQEHAKYKYSFTSEEICAHCGSDDILKLGILSQNDSKCGPRRKTWFEPVHLTFLEFSIAYYLWASSQRKTAASGLELFFKIRDIRVTSTYFTRDQLTLCFLVGLWKKQLFTFCCTLGSGFQVEYWLGTFTYFDSIEELTSESQLTPSELTAAFLPLVPQILFLPSCFNMNSALLLQILSSALRMGRLKSLVFETSLRVVDYLPGVLSQNQTPQLHVFPLEDSQKDAYPKWAEIITCQHVHIVESEMPSDCEVDITLCETGLSEQLSWVSDWLDFLKPVMDKPIRKLKLKLTKNRLETVWDQITELVRKEKVESIKVCRKLRLLPQLWNNFLETANQSKLLSNVAFNCLWNPPLAISLDGSKGKAWQRVELKGNMWPPLFSSDEEPDSQIIATDLPSACMQGNERENTQKCVFYQSGVLSVNNVRELSVTVDETNALQHSWHQTYLKNVQVLAIALSPHLGKDDAIVSSLVSMLSLCHPILELKLKYGCSDEFVRNLLTHFHTECNISTTTKFQAPKYKLDKLTFSRKMVPAESTAHIVELLKDLLQLGYLRELCVSCTRKDSGYATPEFTKLFPPEEGFSCELSTCLKEDTCWFPKELDATKCCIKIKKAQKRVEVQNELRGTQQSRYEWFHR